MIYDKNSNNIYIKDPQPFIIANQNLTRLSSCALMNYNEEKIVICFYGNSDIISLSKFKIDNNYDLIYIESEDLKNKFDRDLRGKRFYIKTIPDDNHLAIFLVSGNYNYILVYNISSKITDNFNAEFLNFNRANMAIINMDYFYETEEILIGAIAPNYSDMKVIKFNPKLKKSNDILKDSFVSKEIKCKEKRTNFILPSNKNYYYLFVDASCPSGEDNLILLNKSSLLLPNITNNFPKELFCYNYYNYEKTSCLDYIPDGYYCNSTDLIMDKTIDKCNENCLLQ
jgi:hypothetical protein